MRGVGMSYTQYRPHRGQRSSWAHRNLCWGAGATSPSLPTLLLGSPWLLSSAKQRLCPHIGGK